MKRTTHKYVRRRRSRRSRLSLVGIGRSGRKDVAERAEELLHKRSKSLSNPVAFRREILKSLKKVAGKGGVNGLN